MYDIRLRENIHIFAYMYGNRLRDTKYYYIIFYTLFDPMYGNSLREK